MDRLRYQRTIFALSSLAVSALFSTPNATAAINVGSSAWTWQNPRPQGNTLNAVSCASSSFCVAVGNLGTILTTTNANSIPPTFAGGRPLTSQDLLGVSCPTTTFCVAVGRAGTVLTYGLIGFDCGSFFCAVYQWSGPLPSTGIPSTVQLNAVSCVSASTCFAVGYNSFVYMTTNGGSSWTPIGGFGGSLTAISCQPTSSTPVCFAVGPYIYGHVLKVFYDFNVGGYYAVDLGNTNEPSTTFLDAISCSTASNCVGVDINGNSITTTNAGNSWSLPVSAHSGALNAISCVTGTQSCMAVGNANANGSNTVALTTNDGASWVGVGVNNGNAYVGPLYGVSCSNFGGQCAALAVGFSGSMAANPSSGVPYLITSYYTTNNPVFLNRASCPEESICSAVGSKGTILTTSNFGSSWTQQTSGTTQTLNAVSCPSTSVCYAVGAGGTILKSTGTWSTQTSGTTLNLTGISCPSASVCIAGGPASSASSILFFTNNGGSTWTPVKTLTGINVQLTSMSCIGAGPTTCDMVFVNGQILQTVTQSNGSTSNPIVLVNGPTRLLDISCPSLATCTAVGDGGVIWSDQAGVWERQTSGTADSLTGVSCLPLSSGTQCVAGSLEGHILFSTGSTWTAQTSLDQELFGVNCAGNAQSSPPVYQCIGVGSNGAIVSLQQGNIGTHMLTPSHGSSEVGDPVSFQLTWTVPAGKVWRDLDHLDLKLIDDSGNTGLIVRFFVGATASDPSPDAVLDANGIITGEGIPGSTGSIETPTFSLDLANSSFEAAGPTSPTVTCTWSVSFKPAAAGNGVSDNAAHVYNIEVGAYDRTGNLSQLDTVGNWAVRQTH